MWRRILFITTDQQRYDALGCNGGRIARTPVADGWARAGLRYERAYNQNAVCMTSRSTMLTGQYVRTHGVYANGVALPVDAPSVAAHLRKKAGYRSIYRDGLLLTAYERSTVGPPNGLEKAMGEWVLTPSGVEYDGTEGELYDVE